MVQLGSALNRRKTRPNPLDGAGWFAPSILASRGSTPASGWKGANSPVDPWQHGHEGGPNGAIGRITYRLDPRVGPMHRPGNRVARGGTQGGLNCLTHVLPRCRPTPTEEANGNGYGAITGRGVRLEAAAQSER